MKDDELRRVIVEALKRIAPEIDASHLDPAVNLREELDLDSMDFLNFVLALHARLGVDIPETDYPHFYTLAGATTYLAAKISANR